VHEAASRRTKRGHGGDGRRILFDVVSARLVQIRIIYSFQIKKATGNQEGKIRKNEVKSFQAPERTRTLMSKGVADVGVW
jgi:hypothetical protein